MTTSASADAVRSDRERAGDVRADPSTEPAVPPPFAGEMCSYAMDVWLDEVDLLTDEAALLDLLRVAAAAGGAQVLGETSAVFPNGAVTAVLLLSQSHLSVHTWPEYRMANFDLLTCGRLNGEHVLDRLRADLRPARSNVVRVIRDVT